MATGKRFYWMKLKENFMTSDTVDLLMEQPNGANYIVLYQMLCLKTINTNGRFERQIGEVIIPYNIEKIKRDCKWFSEDTIRVALNMYQKLGLIYEDVDGVLVIADHDKLVGSETDYSTQKKIQRENHKLLPSVDNCVDNVHSDVHSSSVENVHTDIRVKEIRDKEIRDKKKEVFVVPTVEEIREYCNERNNKIDPEHFYDYYQMTNWFVGKKKMTDWKAAVRYWESTENGRKQSVSGNSQKRPAESESRFNITPDF